MSENKKLSYSGLTRVSIYKMEWILGSRPRMISILMFILFLVASTSAFAEGRLACEIRLNKVIEAAEKSNQCNEDSDCSYVKLIDCSRGCAILPVHWGMQERINIAALDYRDSCGGSCGDSCAKPVAPKCIKHKCDFGLRDWKYKTKHPQTLRQ
jgi:hypothetical protein